MDNTSLKDRTVGVLMGGRSSERDISLKSGSAILQGLLRSGYRAVGVDVGDNLPEQLRTHRIEIAFIALHGRWGEDGTVQGLLEMLGIPYTGSGVLGSSAAMDKIIMKLLLTSKGIPTPPYTTLMHPPGSPLPTGSLEGYLPEFPLPCVVKPAREGSTIGISIVKDSRDISAALVTALKYDSKVLIEGYITGMEITVGVVNGKALPIIQVKPSSGFYDYEAKYTKGMTEYIIPVPLQEHIAEKAYAIALDVYHTFDLAGCARIDMLIDDQLPLVIDINTSPGMTETSLVPKAWAYLGQTFDRLVEEILSEASLKA